MKNRDLERWSVLPLPEVHRFLNQKLKAGGKTIADVFHEAVECWETLAVEEKIAFTAKVKADWPYGLADFRDREEEDRSRYYNVVMLHLKHYQRNLQ